MIFTVAKASLLNRKAIVSLTIVSIAISVFLLLGVQHIKTEAKSNFSRTVSGTDLIVGARTGQTNLLLYSIFRLGNATNNISWKSYQRIKNMKQVKWTVPISLGDSHKGYRVMGTSAEYFDLFKYGEKRPLTFKEGKPFKGVFDVVLGAKVAQVLNYKMGDKLVLTHGISDKSFILHDDKPFTVVGILDPTGTPVDQTLHVSLAGIEAIHIDWQNGAPPRGASVSAEEALKYDLTPKAITAFLVGLNSKIATFQVQRAINTYRNEALMAILPGVALAELWQMLGSVENILSVISTLVLFASLVGMTTMLLASLRERQKEMALMRAVGAKPSFIFSLVQLEVALITLASITLAVLALYAVLLLGKNYILSHYGVLISAQFINTNTLGLLLTVFIGSLIVGLIPSIIAYKQSIHSGLANK